MRFKYKVKNKDGSLSEGYKDANDKFSLSREFREAGVFPIEIKEEGEGDSNVSVLSFNLFKSVSLSEKIMFTKNLSGMLQAGLALTRALQVLEKQSTNMYMKEVLHNIVDDINKGNTLSDSMRKFPKVFSSIFVSMVHSGEESGGLPKVLSELGVNLKKSFDLNKKIKSAMTYPSIIICAIILIAILMMIYVVPTLTQTFKELGTELPKSTQLIIWISDTVSQHTLLVFLCIFLFVGGLVSFAKLKFTQKYFDYIILKIPIVGELLKEMNTARTTRTLSSLLSSGVDMSKALSITQEVLQNIYYKKLINDSIIKLEKGIPLSVNFKEATHLYPVMVGEMIEVGEETGNLSAMLLDIAVFYESEVDNKTKDLSTIIEPVLMVFIGGAVGFFAVSMIKPMYSVMDNIK